MKTVTMPRNLGRYYVMSNGYVYYGDTIDQAIESMLSQRPLPAGEEFVVRENSHSEFSNPVVYRGYAGLGGRRVPPSRD